MSWIRPCIIGQKISIIYPTPTHGLQGLLDRPQLLLKWMYFQQQDPLSDDICVLGNVNATIITDLMPFREYKFSIVVVNLDGRSEIVNISANTLSLGILATRTDTHVHLHVATILCM